MKKVIHNCSTGLLLGAIATVLAGCNSPSELSLSSPSGGSSESQPQPNAVTQIGTLEFRANGEDFVRQGFLSKDGWQIQFDHVYVTLAALTAYSSETPSETASETDTAPRELDSSSSQGIAIKVPKAQTVDLAAGGADASPVLIQSLAVPAVHFQELSWQLAPASKGPAQGQVLQLMGSATKEGQQVNFKIAWDQPYAYQCGEFVGDQRKGIVKAGKTSDVEATFHFDHLFGDGSVPDSDEINRKSLGFDPFATLATADSLEVDHDQLAAQFSSEEFDRLEEIFLGLGHVGEGHCDAEVVRG